MHDEVLQPIADRPPGEGRPRIGLIGPRLRDDGLECHEGQFATAGRFLRSHPWHSETGRSDELAALCGRIVESCLEGAVEDLLCKELAGYERRHLGIEFSAAYGVLRGLEVDAEFADAHAGEAQLGVDSRTAGPRDVLRFSALHRVTSFATAPARWSGARWLYRIVMRTSP
jgi:hypothetical protein